MTSLVTPPVLALLLIQLPAIESAGVAVAAKRRGRIHWLSCTAAPLWQFSILGFFAGVGQLKGFQFERKNRSGGQHAHC